MDKRQIQRFKTRLELHRQELRLSIEHQRQYARKTEAEADVLDRATSAYEKESVLQRSNEEQQLLSGWLSRRFVAFETTASGNARVAGRKLMEDG